MTPCESFLLPTNGSSKKLKQLDLIAYFYFYGLHTHTHTCMHACMHARTHARTHIYIYIDILNNGKNTAKFQVSRVSCNLLYNLYLGSYSIVHDIEHFINEGNNFMVYYMSLSICSLYNCLIYSKISFTIFDTENARDSKKYSYINHLYREKYL